MNDQDDSQDKSFEPTEQKLKRAREQGEVAKSTDVAVSASYLGLLLALYLWGAGIIDGMGIVLQSMIEQSGGLSQIVFDGSAQSFSGTVLLRITASSLPLFLLPLLMTAIAFLAQRAFVFAPVLLKPKLSRLSVISNAKNKYGKRGLFEFVKNSAKLILYSVVLFFFVFLNLEEIIKSASLSSRAVAHLMAEMCIQFLFVVFGIALLIASIDGVWQHAEFQHRNRMSHKELMDETKEAEGDAHLKQERRARAQTHAGNRMMQDVPTADVIIVNPTHFAIALKWSRLPGEAPVCVAKGVDEMAGTIKRVATEHGVPIHSDPPTARALYVSVDIGMQINEDHFKPVAVAIRFAEEIRKKARAGLL
jgi:flagellar biosynthetic protein FlhB